MSVKHDQKVYLIVLETFSKSSSERVQALPINLRYIYKRVFHYQVAPLYSLEVGWRLFVEYHFKVWAEWVQI